MNTGEHITTWGRAVHERTSRTPDAALTELRRRFDSGLDRMRLNKTQLAGRSGLSRTTVQQAYQSGGPVPSRQTVAALAQALKLPVGELLELQRDAGANSGSEAPGLGKPIGQWEPHALEVHPAGTTTSSGTPQQRLLPGYVEREHDGVLAEAVREAGQGRSGMLVLVGESSTGKTRACWEAVQPLAESGWRLWHPFDPTRAAAALEELHRVGPRTVVWLNEAQHYLGDRENGEGIAAAVHALLVEPERGPVLVLGTLWPYYFQQYAALPAAGEEDPHSRVRELLAGRTVNVPAAFDAPALATANTLAQNGDELLADALTRAQADGRLAQDLAGGPALLQRYRTASPAATALLEAAMDARRLGLGLHLPQVFLTDAAADYLHDNDWDQLTDDWAEQAYAELAQQVHGKQAPLRRATPRPQRRPSTPSTPADIPSSPRPVFRLADYLEQHGGTTRRHFCPPASFWHAAITHITHPDHLDNLAKAAEDRYRWEWAHHLYLRAVDHGSTQALYRLAAAREGAGDREGAEALYRQAADHGHTLALDRLVALRERAGDREGAEVLARKSDEHGHPLALYPLAAVREWEGDREGAEALYRQAADHGDTVALDFLAQLRMDAGDREGAEALYRQAIDQGRTVALVFLAQLRMDAGDREGAEALARRAADHGHNVALDMLTLLREVADDREGAEALARRAADHGHPTPFYGLARMREEAGDQKGAEVAYRKAADYGHTGALFSLARLREVAGDQEGAEALAWQAADIGDVDALGRLAGMREEAGDQEGAEALYWQIVDHGDTFALSCLARMREEAGDREGAEALGRRLADHGNPHARDGYLEEMAKRLWPYGLDPDGTPTPPWQWS